MDRNVDRKHDLDYLQWLQQNARVYLTGITILTFFIAFTFCVCFLPPWQPQQSIAFWNKDDSNQAVAEQQAPEKKTEGSQQEAEQQINAVQPTVNQQEQQPEEPVQTNLPTDLPTEPAETPTVQENAMQNGEKSTELNEQAQTQTVDPLTLEAKFAAFTEPCQGTLRYGYGVGYDSRYGDYRFHDALCYQADGGAVLSVANGTVQQLQMDGQWQLVLLCGAYELRYRGLQACHVAVGDTVTAGQAIGTAGELLYVQAVEQTI